MTLEKIKIVNFVEVSSSGVVQVQEKISVKEDGTQIGESLHRHVVAPGDDYAGEDSRVQAICAATHTSDVIAAYKAAIAAQGV